MCVPETVSRPRRFPSLCPIRMSLAISLSPTSIHSYIRLQWSSHYVNTTTNGDSYSKDKRFVLIELDQIGMEGNIVVGRGRTPRKCGHSHHLCDFFLRITYKFVTFKSVKFYARIFHFPFSTFHSLIALEHNMRVL
jgi:hypothetical protein